MKAKEKDYLSTPHRSSRIAKAKNTGTKKSSRRKKANQWICKGIKNGSLCFRLVKKISAVLLPLRQKFAKFQDFLSTNFCQIPRRKQKTCKGRKLLVDGKPIILDSFNQSLQRRIVLNFYCPGEIPNLEKKYIERPKTRMTFNKWESNL